jgi:polyhydroxyalkanoate synthesis regulator phasin
MNIINNNPNRINWANKNYNNNVNTEVQNKVHKLNEKTQDRVEISTEGINAYNNSSLAANTSEESDAEETKPMDNLVSTGIISKEQQITVENALKASKKTLITESGTYTNKYVNPLDKLVATGAINNDQKKAIQEVIENEKQSRISQRMSGGTENLQTQMDELNKNAHLSPMDNLVASGLMTQDEKKAIQSTFSA